MPLCSIIIPVYNAEKTIERCLNSILECSFDDYEIVLVNDGSTDNSLSLCKAFAEKNYQIKLYDYPNAGAGAARNRGIEHSQGKFIMFCDADDWFDTEKLDELLCGMEEQMENIDLLCFDYRRVWEDSSEDIHHIKDQTYFLSEEEKYCILSSSRLSKEFSIAVWNKVFKRDVILQNHISFPERDTLGNQDDWGEDLIFVFQYFVVSKKIKDISSWILFNNIRVPFTKSDERYFTLTRVLHMIKILRFFQEKDICVNHLSSNQFTIVAIFHLHNYVYEIVNKKSVEYLRRQILSDVNKTYIINLLKNSVSCIDHTDFSEWGQYGVKEYKYILQYLLNGNLFMFKIKNKMLYSFNKNL